jgi:hypothetical protein
MFVEEDNEALLLSDSRGDEDQDVRFLLFSAKRKADGFKAEVIEAFQDFVPKTAWNCELGIFMDIGDPLFMASLSTAL